LYIFRAPKETVQAYVGVADRMLILVNRPLARCVDVDQ
jgi:hypothetical protein